MQSKQQQSRIEYLERQWIRNQPKATRAEFDRIHEIELAGDLPSGIYLCPCHTIKFRLTWDTYLDADHKPRLERVTDAE